MKLNVFRRRKQFAVTFEKYVLTKYGGFEDVVRLIES